MTRLPYLRSFRLVADRGDQKAVERLLRAEGFEFEPEPFSPLCRRLVHEPMPLGASLAAYFGYIYIQDRSSMLPPLALNPPPGSAVLDMCASPGSKSGFLAQLTGQSGFVLANEPNPARLASLRANLRVCNLVQTGTCSYAGDAIPHSPGSWSYILLDPPCSGWGTVDKNPSAVKIWQGDNVKRLVNLQQALLRKAASLLSDGGLLAYSTCTTNPAENEAQTVFAEQELGLERVILEPFPGFTYEERPGGEGALQVRGRESSAQGFYISLLRKPCAATPMQAITPHLSFNEIARKQLRSPICEPDRLPAGRIGAFAERLRFLPELALHLLPDRFRWQGAPLGRVSGAHIHMDPRLRITLPRVDDQDAPRVVQEDIEEVRAMLNGQIVLSPCRANQAGLWWQDLPLGAVSLKNGRVIASFH